MLALTERPTFLVCTVIGSVYPTESRFDGVTTGAAVRAVESSFQAASAGADLQVGRLATALADRLTQPFATTSMPSGLRHRGRLSQALGYVHRRASM